MLSNALTATQQTRIVRAAEELARRQIDALKLYEPQPKQDAFHRSRASERTVRGGNRSGKSMCTFVETARAARGLDPHQKYPNRALLIYVIGYDEDHIGRVIHRMLFRANAFKIIRDAETGKWRAFRPWTPEDKAREHETKPAPPLIPESEIDEWAWVRKSERVFAVCRLKNGTEIRAFSSKAEPAQGDPVDLVHIDEDLKLERWVGEMQARLSDNKGKLIWGAFPHSRNDALLRMSERAQEQAGRELPDIEEFVLTYSSNPFIDADEKRKRIEGWSDEERNARDYGEFTTGSVLMYPNFSMVTHGVPREGPQDKIDEIIAKARSNDKPLRYDLPDEWCRYLSIDPGHTVCAVLFAAIPPDYLGDYVVLYDELYIRQCDANKLAEAISSKIYNQVFQAFIIDDHGSRVTQGGSGTTIRGDYAAAFQRRGIRSIRTGHDFFPGSDDVIGGCARVRDWLSLRPDQTSKLRVAKDACPNFEKEIRAYKKRIDGDLLHGGETRDMPVQRNNHAMDALRYLAMFNPTYIRPRLEALPPTGAYAGFLALKKDKTPEDKSIYLAA